MFRVDTSTSGWAITWRLLDLIFHASVRHIRKTHGNALIGLLMVKNNFSDLNLMIEFYFAD